MTAEVHERVTKLEITVEEHADKLDDHESRLSAAHADRSRIEQDVRGLSGVIRELTDQVAEAEKNSAVAITILEHQTKTLDEIKTAAFETVPKWIIKMGLSLIAAAVTILIALYLCRIGGRPA